MIPEKQSVVNNALMMTDEDLIEFVTKADPKELVILYKLMSESLKESHSVIKQNLDSFRNKE